MKYLTLLPEEFLTVFIFEVSKWPGVKFTVAPDIILIDFKSLI